MRIRANIVGLALLAAAVTGAGAAGAPARAGESAFDLLDVAQPYRADFTLSSARGSFRGTVWHAPGRERREVATSSGSQALLIRRDSDIAYLIGNRGAWTVELSLSADGALSGAIETWQVERRRQGE